MNKYSSYKDSGVEWIGEIPKHWQNGRVKNLIDNSKYYQIGDGDHGSIKPEMYQEQGVPYIRVQNLNWDGQIDKKGLVFISDEVHLKNQKSKLILNDILIAKTGATVGKLGIIDEQIGESNTTSSVGKITINQNKHSAHFFLYFFQCDFFQKLIWLKSEGKSAQPSFNIIDLIDFPVLILPFQEQEQIVTYLDKKTSIVDTLISSKEQKINLLKEKRTALINHVITKGLDPKVKLKDSGIEWIGEIPEHWEVKALKYIIKNLNSGTSVNSENNPIYESNEKGVLKTSCVYGDVFRPTENKQVVIEEYNRVQCPVIKNTIIISRMNTPDLVGSNGYVDENYPNLFLPDRLWITDFFDNKNLIVKWLSYVFKSNKFKRELSSRSTGTSDSMKNITKDDLLTIKIPFTGIEEQQQMSEYLDVHLNEIDELILLEQKKIETLKEYRQAMISEVVTGKIKVVKD